LLVQLGGSNLHQKNRLGRGGGGGGAGGQSRGGGPGFWVGGAFQKVFPKSGKGALGQKK